MNHANQAIARYMTSENSRRAFFSLSAKVFAGTSAVGAAIAQTTTPPTTTDIDVLNYALTLEYLEATFYSQYLGAIAGQSSSIGSVPGANPTFRSSDALGSTLLNGLNPFANANFYSYLTAIRDHEVAHVNAIKQTITSLGGTPVQPCTYKFPVTTFDSFLQVAQALENTGVSAYDGAINMIKAPAVVQAGATIATVEARHAAFLNLIAGGAFGSAQPQSSSSASIPGVNSSPFPSAFDTPLMMSQVLAIAGPFLGNCPTPPNVPPAIVTFTPSTTTFTQLSTTISAAVASSVAGPAKVEFQVAPGGKLPAILQRPNSNEATIQFVNGPGLYILQVQVTDANGNKTIMPLPLTYQP